MLTHIDIDQEKVDEIMASGDFKSKKEVVDVALTEYLKKISAKALLKLRGSKVWEGDLNEMRTD
ncbi:MAG: type II toxin-antitoxin system VapB family antitoxin [Spirosomaceae bacterium]|nr:type II toxin-antitoxin system VapB family antitoxin [Spirosomataceae bacterium]